MAYTAFVYSVSAVMSMYTGAKTVVRTVYGNSNSFEVKIGMHQDSPLSPLVFVIAMEALSREFRVALPWELLYADDLVVIAAVMFSRTCVQGQDQGLAKKQGQGQGQGLGTKAKKYSRPTPRTFRSRFHSNTRQ